MAREHVLYVNKWSTDIEAFEAVALNENLSKTDYRVFMMLCGHLCSTRVYKIDTDQMARTLGISEKDFKKSLSHLEDNAIISKESDEYAKKGYKMSYVENPSI